MKLKTFNGAKGHESLSHLPFNRNYTLRRGLVESMQEFGFIQAITVVKTNVVDGIMRHYIIDGQHRALAAAYLDIPFQATILKEEYTDKAKLIKIIAKLNNSAKQWNNQVYVEAFASLGMSSYKTLLQLTEETPYSVVTIGSMLMTTQKRGSVGKYLKDGTFEVYNLKSTTKSLELIKQLKGLSARMLLAFHWVRTNNENFKFEVFKENLHKDYETIKASKLNEYTDLFNSWF